MYLRMASFGAFGVEDGPEQSPNNPFDQAAPGGDILATARVTSSGLVVQLLECGAELIPGGGGGKDAAADCVWRILRGIIDANPQATAIEEVIANHDLAGAVSMLGLPSSVISGASTVLGGDIWGLIRAKAAAALNADLRNIPDTPTALETYEANFARGRDRSDAEGGGHTLVNEAGQEIRVRCPGYVRSIGYDAAGNPAVYVMEIPKDYPAGTACPQDVPGVVRGSSGTPVLVPEQAGEATTGTTRTYTFQLRQPTVELRILPPGRLTGRVVDAGGKPVVGAEIRVGSMQNRVAGSTDATGAFDVSAPAATVRVYVTAAGFQNFTGQSVLVQTGATVDAGLLTMKRLEGGTLKTEEGAWYSSPWVWVAGLAVVGAAGYGIYRYTRK